MELRGSYSFDAPVSTVWALLTDPAAIARCMPGCERLEPIGDDRYQMTITVGIAAIKGSYQGVMAITEKIPTSSYTLLVDGKGSLGFIKGQGRVSLTAQGEKTVVEVMGEARVGGTIARVGQRLLGTTAKMMMDRFFTCLQTVDR